MDANAPTRVSSQHEIAQRFAQQIDAAYRRRIRRQCSREDFAEGYVAGLVDWMPLDRPPTTEEESHVQA